jgi:hypothetical protein
MTAPITIGSATITYTPDGALTTYWDEASYGAQPHDTPDYATIAERCGYGVGPAARLAYCREHEVCHHVVSEWITGVESKVLWPLAHGFDPDPADAVLEEALAMAFQRWLRAGERPIIGGVDWDGLKARTLALLGESVLACDPSAPPTAEDFYRENPGAR